MDVAPYTDSRQRDHPPHATEAPGHQGPLSVLVVAPSDDRVASQQLLDLGRALRQLGDQYRAITSDDWLHKRVHDVGASSQIALPPSADVAAHRSPGLLAHARAILLCLQAEQTDIVQCHSVRACYAAALAIYLLAFSRPRFREPAIVTTLPPGRTGAQHAADARRLRFLCDALVVRSTAECDAVVRHGFPIERVAIVPTAGAVVTAMREVYLEARACVARRALLQMSYMV